MSIIKTQQLTRSYGKHRGIERLDLDIPQGSVYGFLGPNGAGKTTAIRVMLGLLRPTAGQATIFDRDCWRDSHTIKRDLGYLPGDLRLYAGMTGRSILKWLGQVRGRDLMPRARDLSDDFGLDLLRKVRQMSRGTRQKLGLVMAMAHEPELLILDEPTASLDPIMQQKLLKRLRAMADGGHTVFFSSHTLSEVDQLCDRVAIIREGRLVTEQSLAALRDQAGHWVTLRWQDDAAIPQAPPAFLEVNKRDGRTWEGRLNGPVDPFVAWLSGRTLEDLSISPPDLETLFHHYYQNGCAPEAGSAETHHSGGADRENDGESRTPGAGGGA